MRLRSEQNDLNKPLWICSTVVIRKILSPVSVKSENINYSPGSLLERELLGEIFQTLHVDTVC